ncbi:MAG TPA: three component ABC system middle component [Candidatus Thermoplasmatota archaeon]|nr:three component ABC system middle component [Candidatus Thermoplasmatota archaeon]
MEEGVALDRYAHKNPAFAAVVIHAVAKGYSRKQGRGIPIPWAILSIPYLASKSVRDQIPKAWNAKLTNLFENHPQWQAQNAEALRSNVKYFWPALRLGISRGILVLQEGRISASGKLRPSELDEYREIYDIADKFGRFLGKEPEETIPNLFNLEVTE